MHSCFEFYIFFWIIFIYCVKKTELTKANKIIELNASWHSDRNFARDIFDERHVLPDKCIPKLR